MVSASQPDENTVTLYSTVTQQYVHAQQVRWTLLYNFVVASSVFLLGWVTLFVAAHNVKYSGVLLIGICLVGIAKCIIWFFLGSRANKFVRLFNDMGQKVEDQFTDSLLPRPFQESEVLRSKLKGGARIPAWLVFVVLPFLFLALYSLLLIISILSLLA